MRKIYSRGERIYYILDLKSKCFFPNKNLLEGLVAITGVRECWLKSALDTIDEVYGGIIGYCKQILSTTEEDIKIIRENYLR